MAHVPAFTIVLLLHLGDLTTGVSVRVDDLAFLELVFVVLADHPTLLELLRVLGGILLR